MVLSVGVLGVGFSGSGFVMFVIVEGDDKVC